MNRSPPERVLSCHAVSTAAPPRPARTQVLEPVDRAAILLDAFALAKAGYGVSFEVGGCLRGKLVG